MIAILMGVSGTGKSTVGKDLAADLGWTFVEGDDFHPAANKQKMYQGIPLTDDDRRPWLKALGRRIDEAREHHENVVLACSALKHSYQEYLKEHDLSDVRFVFLTAPRDVLRQRLEDRTGHFMNPALLDSQLATLEPPEPAITVDVQPPPEKVAAEIVDRLEMRSVEPAEAPAAKD